MRKGNGILLFLMIISGVAIGNSDDQYQISPYNADCSGAIKVSDSIFGPTNPPDGFGNILEFSGNELGNPYFIEEEHHTVWYYFEMPASGKLTFEIIPVSVEDDYDFMLFSLTTFLFTFSNYMEVYLNFY